MTWRFSWEEVEPTTSYHRKQMEIRAIYTDTDDNETWLEPVRIGLSWDNGDNSVATYVPERLAYRRRGADSGSWGSWASLVPDTVTSFGRIFADVAARGLWASMRATDLPLDNMRDYFSIFDQLIYQTPGWHSFIDAFIPACQVCQPASHTCIYAFMPGHPLCGMDDCTEPVHNDGTLTRRPIRVFYNGSSIQLCQTHSADVVTCQECGSANLPDNIVLAADRAQQEIPGVPPTEFDVCTGCDEGWRRAIDSGDYDCQNCGDTHFQVINNRRRFCSTCDIAVPDWRINNYSYKPTPIFHPEVPDDPRTLYHGMEFEVAHLPYDSAQRWAEKYSDQLMADFIYMKSDSSVYDGVEVVTHPFTIEWARVKFPYAAFQAAVDEFGASPTHESAGTHIHVSKSSFSSPHLWKFLQLHFRLPSFLQKLGGRGSVSYANWQLNALRDKAAEFAKEKKLMVGVGNRSVAVNTRPEHTIELRYPASGFSAALAQKNVELPNALWQFTNELTIQHVKDGILDNPGALQWWIAEEKAQFPALYAYMQKQVPTVTPFERSN